MKITVLTSNQPRHLNLVNKLASVADTCYAVIESNTLFPGQTDDFFKKSDAMQQYFGFVQQSERRFFGLPCFTRSNVDSLVMKAGDLNKLDRDILAPALKSDVYVVFGSSYIKGWLIDELVANRAINIHMGVSPYYRGSSCNFWASHEGNFHMIGATIHLLSKGLDSGDILYHALPTTDNCNSLFDYTMKSVVSAHNSLVDRISNRTIMDFRPLKQDKTQEVKYTRNLDFTDDVALNFLGTQPSMNVVSQILTEQRKKVQYIEPFFA